MENSNFTAEDARKISLPYILLNKEEKLIYEEVIQMIRKAAENRLTQIRILLCDCAVGTTKFDKHEQMLMTKLKQNGFKTKKESQFVGLGNNYYLIVKW